MTYGVRDRSLRSNRLFPLLALLAAGCASATMKKPANPDGAETPAADASSAADKAGSAGPGQDGPAAAVADTGEADKAPPAADGPAAERPGAGPDGPAAPEAPAAPTTCGDIVPEPGHPPFDAIKRLATTSDEVRILVYGQSISEQVWWQQVRDWLKQQYPKGKLVMEMHAHGGCPSQCLLGRDPWGIDHLTFNRIPPDVFAWNPDLIIFHVTGRHDDYETIIKSFKQGCSAFDDHPAATAHCKADARYPSYKPAEVLVQTYHRVNDTDYQGPLPALPPIPLGQWDYWMSTVWIPGVARAQGAGVARIWQPWWDYLQANKLKASALLVDDVHLNDAGNKLMADLTKRSLCYIPPR
jgi:hypothetical protein